MAVTQLLKRTIILPWIIIVLLTAQILYWSLDNDVPMTRTSYTSTPSAPGGTTFIAANVERDMVKDCELEFSRYMLDSTGYRFEITGVTHMTSSTLAAAQRRSPDKILLAVEVPSGASKGPAVIFSDLRYMCNPVQRVFPLHRLMTYNFEVQ